MATISLQVNYRPLRIAFLVRDGNFDDLISAARLNTALWGGIYNAIVPVGGDPDLPDRLIRLFQADVLHPVSNEPQVQAVFERYPWLAWPERPKDSGLAGRENGNEYLDTLDVMSAIECYREREFRPGAEKTGCAIASWEAGDPLNALFCLQFGQYREEEAGYANAYEREMPAERVPLDSSSVPDALSSRISPIQFTKYGLSRITLPFDLEMGVYVGSPDDYVDLLNYWNLRAAGKILVFWPLAGETGLMAYTRSYLSGRWEQLRNQPRHHGSIAVFATINNVQPEEAKARAAQILPTGARVSWWPVDERTWRGPNVKPPIYAFESQTVLADIEDRQGISYRITFALPAKPVPTATARGSPAVLQQCAIGVRPLTEYGYKGHTLRPPNCPDLNEWLGRTCVLHPWSLRAQPQGIAVIVRLYQDTLRLYPIRRRDLIVHLLAHSGIAATPSTPGRIADRLIDQMGGLEGCRVFKIPGVRKLVEHRDARKGLTRGTATELIYDKDPAGFASFDNHKTLFIESREKSDLSTHDVLNYLLTKRILRPGLLLRCPNCVLDSWFPVRSLRDQCICELCGHEFPIGPQLRGEGDWRFRLSGLFGRDDHQQGSIPVALTLLQLRRVLGRGRNSFHYSTGLQLSGESVNCESDLIVMHTDREGRGSFVVGECKTSLPVESDTVAKLVNARHAICRAGFPCYLMFSKTSGAFTDAELDGFRALRSDRVPIILFTARELEPYDPYGMAEDTKELPCPSPSSLDDIALNSAYRYLDTPGAADQ
jgi:hypothetical protein